MSKIFFQSEAPRNFLVDSKGDMYKVSDELIYILAQSLPLTILTRKQNCLRKWIPNAGTNDES